MGRLTTLRREARIDPSLARRSTVPRSGRSSCSLGLHNVAEAAYYAGRSCYFRPLFDRPRQWAALRSPRVAAASVHKSSGAS
jgi:hypothetical protein